MSQLLLQQLDTHLDAFLDSWTEHMREAGYLALTTAKREDCIASFRGVMEAVRCLAPQAGVPAFAPMLRDCLEAARDMVQIARNHRARGITEGMFLGCFKTLIHSLEDTVLELELPAESRVEALLKIRRVCDVLETVFVDDWEQARTHDMMEQLQSVNRRLTLKKNKYENIYRGTSDLVLLTDARGQILEANPEAEKYLPSEQITGRPFWDFLQLDCQDMDQVLTRWPADESHEVSSREGRYVFILRIVPLSRVSLASRGYMLILSDITLIVDHLQELERRVEKRTAALLRSRELLNQEKAQTEEMNVTLKNVMKSIESERRDLEQNVSRKISCNLVPALDKLRQETNAEVRASYLELIREQLISLTAGFDSELDAGMLKLTKTELNICRFIQAGCTTKEIGEAMNLAFETIQTHRKNIRKKLGLHGQSINLHAFLANRQCTSPGEN